MSGRSRSGGNSSDKAADKSIGSPKSPNSHRKRSSSNDMSIVYDYQKYPKSNSSAEDEKAASGFDIHIKLLMLGDSGVGKSSLLMQYSCEEFNQNFVTTIGIDYKIKLLKFGKTKIKLQIWDTAGQERFRTITTSYFKGAHGIMLVYDVTDRESFQNIAVWAKDIKKHAEPQVCIILIGNKKDLSSMRDVSYEEGLNVARKMNVHFYEVSAKSGENVSKAYESITLTTKESLTNPENIKKKPKLDSVVLGDSNTSKNKSQEFSSRIRQDTMGSPPGRKSNCC